MTLKKNDAVYIKNMHCEGVFIKYNTDEDEALVKAYLPDEYINDYVFVWCDVINLTKLDKDEKSIASNSLIVLLREVRNRLHIAGYHNHQDIIMRIDAEIKKLTGES